MNSGYFSSSHLPCWLPASPRTSISELPQEQPQTLGFSADRLDHIDQFYDRKIKNGQLAGMVILIARHGEVAHFRALGMCT